MTRRPEIPQSDLKPGIQRCFEQARNLLKGAGTLVASDLTNVASDLTNAAANLFVLAVQEIGKAKLLHEALVNAQTRTRIDDFRDHDVKTKKGIALLGSIAGWLVQPAFQRDAFQADAFQVGIAADEPTRLDLLYVNYGSGRWLDPPRLDASVLRRIIDEVIAQLPAVEEALVA